jgi:hypothetical protein
LIVNTGSGKDIYPVIEGFLLIAIIKNDNRPVTEEKCIKINSQFFVWVCVDSKLLPAKSRRHIFSEL